MGGIVDLDNSHLLPIGTTRAMVLESNNRALLERIGHLDRRNGELELALKAALRDKNKYMVDAANMRDAIANVRHWHNTGRDDEGTVMSTKSFWKLHEAANADSCKTLGEIQADALENIAKSVECGGKARFVRVVYKTEPTLLYTSIGIVEASDLMSAAARLRGCGND